MLWRSEWTPCESATDKQLAKLQKLGVYHDPKLSIGEASSLISEKVGELKGKRPDVDVITALRRWQLAEPSSAEEAVRALANHICLLRESGKGLPRFADDDEFGDEPFVSVDQMEILKRYRKRCSKTMDYDEAWDLIFEVEEDASEDLEADLFIQYGFAEWANSCFKKWKRKGLLLSKVSQEELSLIAGKAKKTLKRDFPREVEWGIDYEESHLKRWTRSACPDLLAKNSKKGSKRKGEDEDGNGCTILILLGLAFAIWKYFF